MNAHNPHLWKKEIAQVTPAPWTHNRRIPHGHGRRPRPKRMGALSLPTSQTLSDERRAAHPTWATAGRSRYRDRSLSIQSPSLRRTRPRRPPACWNTARPARCVTRTHPRARAYCARAQPARCRLYHGTPTRDALRRLCKALSPHALRTLRTSPQCASSRTTRWNTSLGSLRI